MYLAAGVKAIDPAAPPLRITSSVRDQAYQDLLLQSNPEATSAYSLHTTGYAFDVLRRFSQESNRRIRDIVVELVETRELPEAFRSLEQ